MFLERFSPSPSEDEAFSGVRTLWAAVDLKSLCLQEEQAAKLKAEKIRVALEKIKEAQVKKVKRWIAAPWGLKWLPCSRSLLLCEGVSCF